MKCYNQCHFVSKMQVKNHELTLSVFVVQLIVHERYRFFHYLERLGENRRLGRNVYCFMS